MSTSINANRTPEQSALEIRQALQRQANSLSAHTHTSADITDFNEAAQDAIGLMVANSTHVSLTYVDATPSLTAAITDIELLALAGLTSAADKFPYFTGSGTAALADLSSAMRTFLTTPTSANFASVLSDETFRNDDAELGAIAGLTSAADKGIMFTGAGTASTYSLTAAALTILDDTTVGAIRTTLGVGTGDSPQFTAIELNHASANTLTASGGHMTIEGATVWDSGNDGSGSGLDADLLDGKNIGTSGNTIPLLDGANSWTNLQTFLTAVQITAADPYLQITDTTDNSDCRIEVISGRLVFYADYNSESVGSYVGFSVDTTGTANGMKMDSARLQPYSDGGLALGLNSASWAHLFLASGGAINWNDGDVTMQHSAGLLTISDPVTLGTSNAFTCGSIELGAASDTTIARASAGVISVEGKPLSFVGWTYSAKSADFTVAATEYDTYYNVSTAGATVTATLPSAVTAGAGFKIGFRKANDTSTPSDRVILATVSSQTINNTTTGYTIWTYENYVVIVSDGANWMVSDPGMRANRNFIDNPCCEVSQEYGTTQTASTDGSYGHDRWIALHEGDFYFAQVTGLATNPIGTGTTKFELEAKTTNSKFGYLQVLSNKASAQLICGGVGRATLSFYARYEVGTTMAKIRFYILTWDTASGGRVADTVTRDCVSTWNASDADITPATGWTIEGSGTGVPTTSWRRFVLPNIAIDTASAANIAVFITNDDTDSVSAGDELEITGVKLEEGSCATPFESKPIEQELEACYREYTILTGGAAFTPVLGYGFNTATTTGHYMCPVPVPMRVFPSLTATADHWVVVSGVGSARDVSAISVDSISGSPFNRIKVNATFAADTANLASYLLADATGSRTLKLDSRL